MFYKKLIAVKCNINEEFINIFLLWFGPVWALSILHFQMIHYSLHDSLTPQTLDFPDKDFLTDCQTTCQKNEDLDLWSLCNICPPPPFTLIMMQIK